MILYFSGTGNTKAVAERLGEKLKEDVVQLTSTSPVDLKYSGPRLIFVFPIYSWGVAPLILGYVEKLNLDFLAEARKKRVWVVCTCGDDTGRAPEMFERSLNRVGLTASGIWSVQMPNNYVLLPGFDVDNKEIEQKKLSEYIFRVDSIAEKIEKEAGERDFVAGSLPGLKTALVYPLFKHFGIFPSKWIATDACVGCKRCENVCPMHNIAMKNGKPVWGKNCVSCLACFHVCPRNAVQYGKATRGKGQYMFPIRNSNR